jgi:hypothetical protein
MTRSVRRYLLIVLVGLLSDSQRRPWQPDAGEIEPVATYDAGCRQVTATSRP